ncbi:hypothetical protein Thiowin_04025 [Thiorhodovibrio winogradskyi]|uniref:Uncharacterized protein n=1 Tax=Thiorhodovibrio winogradskyi TaxID=77007 RepID=A0ABZ0SF30_9GAMM|nr:hypothetical protein [Thiorhodovibrio winogradskyi]
MPKVIIDPDSHSLAELPALVKATRKSRARFPAGCVEPMASEQEACSRALERPGWQAAIVYGPSASSEGQRLYYLVRWLNGVPEV